jgi:hypothetical protein
LRQPIEHVKPLVITTIINEVEVTISPITVGQYPALFAHLRPLLDIIPQVPQGLFDRIEQKQTTDADMMWLADMLMEYGQQLLDVLALATKQPRYWVEDLLLDCALELVLLVLQVNSDFFSRARGPMAAMLESARASLPPAAPASTGPTPSAP